VDTRQTITQIYRDYENGDVAKILAALPDNFVFEFTSDPSMARYAGMCRTKDELVQHLQNIAEYFQFNGYRATNILVDGSRAAAEVQVDLTSKASGRRFSATIAHFWSFEQGIPVRLVEYMDSAWIASQSAPTVGDTPFSVRA
jgi:ketosteroid isomerase-like protein